MTRTLTTKIALSHRYGDFLGKCRSSFSLLLMLLGSAPLFSQTDYDEVLVNLAIKRFGSVELVVVIKNESAYLPVSELFDMLKIRNVHSASFDSISGYFMDPKSLFIIRANEKQISYKGEVFNLGENGLVITPGGLYLETPFFGQVFGLDCVFDIRSLSVALNSAVELPVIREMEQDRMRKNISQLKGEKKADTLVENKFSWFKVGTADWSVSTVQEPKNNSTRLNLGLGGALAGGDVSLNMNYMSDRPWDPNQQFYHWKYVNNNQSALRQVTVGRIFVPSLSTILAPMTGIQISNSPTTYRKSFGTYRLSNNTQPNWMVELYINNTLVDYVKADAAGFYTFDVPLMFGNSIVKLRFYGPYGEEQIREQYMNIPFNFIPLHQLEYTVSAGIIGDQANSRFSRTNINYGLTKHVTVGTGLEYLSSASKGRPMPFMNVSARIGSSFIVSGEFAPGVRTHGTLSYQHRSRLQLDLNYSKFDKEQTAIRFRFMEERKASLSMPFSGKHFSAFSRLTYNSYIMPKSGFKSVEFLFSSRIYGISSSLQTMAYYTNLENFQVYSNLSFNLRLPAGVLFRPLLEYQHHQKQFNRIRGEVEKRVSKNGSLNLSHENNFIYKTNLTTMGFRYDFSFAQTSFLVRRMGKTTSLLQSARGSIVYNAEARLFDFNSQPNLGRGGLIILPFLDLNNNGKKDPQEPKAPGLKLRGQGRSAQRSEKDGTLFIKGLEAYSCYIIELDKDSYEEISWKIKKPAIKVTIAPNQLKTIEVPVSVVGEASGNVFLDQKGAKTGLGRMIINFYNAAMVQVGRTLTEEDGYFSYLGFAPGAYTASIDTTQLGNLKMASLPGKLSFRIKVGEQGDVVEKLEFVVAPNGERGVDQ